MTGATHDELLALVTFNADGLVPAIAQQHDTGEVLMMAWMNREAIGETLDTGRVCYYSRSRAGLWRKGETSGQVQHLKELRVLNLSHNKITSLPEDIFNESLELVEIYLQNNSIGSLTTGLFDGLIHLQVYTSPTR